MSFWASVTSRRIFALQLSVEQLFLCFFNCKDSSGKCPEKLSSRTATGWSPSCPLVTFPSSAFLYPPPAAVGSVTRITNSADCGKQIGRQGQYNWQVAEYLRKARMNFLASELFVSEGEIPVICSSRSIPHLCCVKGVRGHSQVPGSLVLSSRKYDKTSFDVL